MLNKNELDLLQQLSNNNKDTLVEKIKHFEKKFSMNSFDAFWYKENYDKNKQEWKKIFNKYMANKNNIYQINHINPIKKIAITSNDIYSIKSLIEKQFGDINNRNKYMLEVEYTNKELEYLIQKTNYLGVILVIHCNENFVLDKDYNNIFLIKSETPKIELIKNNLNFLVSNMINDFSFIFKINQSPKIKIVQI